MWARITISPPKHVMPPPNSHTLLLLYAMRWCCGKQMGGNKLNGNSCKMQMSLCRLSSHRKLNNNNNKTHLKQSKSKREWTWKLLENYAVLHTTVGHDLFWRPEACNKQTHRATKMITFVFNYRSQFDALQLYLHTLPVLLKPIIWLRLTVLLQNLQKIATTTTKTKLDHWI